MIDLAIQPGADPEIAYGLTQQGRFGGCDHEERLEHRSRFIDIVDNRRISTVYDFLLNDVLKFASLLTLRFEQLPEGTRVDYTEQYQCFDVAGDGSAERGERRGATLFYLRRLKIAVEEPDGTSGAVVERSGS